MNKFIERTNKKKESIILASLALFSENGFKKTNIKMIASKANVSQVSIYNYFENKDSLIAYCIEYIMKDISSSCEVILEENISFEQKLKKTFEICNSNLGKKIEKYFAKEVLEDEKLSELIIRNVILYKREISRKIIEAGKEEGKINPQIRTKTILDVIDAINLVGSRATADEIDGLAKEMETILLDGILVQE